MASIIQGFEYDIFISYRQKDNKGDHWVTEFISALKTELEATFKEDITIYFDENPHDGLLETHHVDKSLEGKLKCLIFIPIISQTYCDAKSFAWQNEFCAFNKLAKQDKFGREIRLSNGNVASRILPVKIHDLTTEDQTLLESELNGTLRAIEFIYKSAGVNRPLRAIEEEPKENVNHTLYRNQINKVANAIKEIITALQGHPITSPESKPTPARGGTITKRTKKVGALFGLLFVLALIAYFIITSKRDSSVREIDKSIAVLPFVNMSNDPDQEYFCDGMTEQIITSLTNVSNLKVIARTSVMRFKKTDKTVSEISKELGVTHVLEGSIRKSDNRIRVSAKLVKADDGFHLWAKDYDRQPKDIFAVQDDVSKAIAEAMKINLTGEQTAAMVKHYTDNPEAYQAYLKGFHHARKFTKDGSKKGLEYFRQALALDLNYAPAYAGLAFSYIFSLGDWYIPNREAFPQAKEASLKALEIDESLAEAHTYLALTKFIYDLDWTGAEQEFRRAIQLKPGDAPVHHWYGMSLGAQGRFETGMQEIRRALELDPLSLEANHVLGMHLYYWRRYDDAIEQLRRTLELEPTYFWAEMVLGQAYEQKRQFQEAIAAFERARRVTQEAGESAPEILAGLARSYALAGRREEAVKVLGELKTLTTQRYVSSHDFATLYLALGDKEQALVSLEKAYEDRNWWMPWLKVEPRFDSLQSEPRFKNLLRKLNLEHLE